MKKLNRKPVYSAKPGECENVLVKDYGKQVVADTGWQPYPLLEGGEIKTTIEKEGGVYHVKHETKFGLFLPPLQKNNL